MKKIIILCAVLGALVLSCASTGGAQGEGQTGFWTWGVFNDVANGGSSRINLIEDVETIDGEVYMTYRISGEITNQYEYGYAGWYAYPDNPTQEMLKTISSFSFKVLGDGNTYFIMFATSDIEDSSFYRTTFTTKKGQVTTHHVRVGSLQQPDDWGIKKRFNQENALQIQWQTTNNGKPGTFDLKVYDIRLYK